MMSGRSHDDSACTLNTALTQEEKHSFDQSLDFCWSWNLPKNYVALQIKDKMNLLI